ncbi:SusC/RagA family TonB-linked outer membrane protein [Pedobacter hiemivivus]|uniref:SusC/RagA family TonB-linked outer membrane protein n=1 Tax=Pedobacter hiemivivus TaxID=2530454 RepID=A0A4R0NHM6_9SPHI|nr:SusC/RagA family TonB-linked outer membrane protein [Pedobacter hiemivivus]TCC98832.1 SusC/RagA family TonB-linked outer membrane protein [Pedobacter hiemivivus]
MYKKNTTYLGVLEGCAHKIWLIMRLTTVILIATMMQVSATGLAQKINLTKVNSSLREIVRDLGRQTGYDFVATDALLKTASNVTINVKDAEFLTVLGQIFENQPITYIIDGKTVTLKPKEKSFVQTLVERFQEITIWGRVTDEKGTLLPGATVKYKDKMTRTDLRGEFILKNVDPNTILEISYIGYETKQVKAQQNMGTIILKPSDSKLDEVQVIAYGQQTRRLSVGSVSTVTAKDIERQPVSNLLDALQGQVAGLSITTTGGVPGSRTLSQIRGQNNLSSNPQANAILSNYDQPLIIVDGIHMPLQNKALIGSSFATGGGNDFWKNQTGLSSMNGINPLDIESVSILKDADATSIYGSQGSNGVILITTKKAKAGRDALSVSLNQGFTNASGTVPMMNTEQYLAMRREALVNSKITANPTNDPDLVLFDQNKNTDWMKEFYGGTAHRTDLHFSLGGGSGSDSYLVNGGYNRTTYNYPGDMADKRYNLHTSYTHKSIDQRFKLQFGTDYAYNVNNNSGEPNGLLAFTLAPNYPDLIDASGKPVWIYNGINLGNSGQGNPLAYLFKSAINATHSLNSHVNLSYDILPSLTLGITAGYARTDENFNSINPIASQNPTFAQGNTNLSSRNTDMINVNPQLNFTKAIGNGLLTVLVGGTYKRNYSKGLSTNAFGYTSDAMLDYIGAAQSTSSSNNASYYKYIDLFSRINYRWADKYILNITANRDGSSNFGPRKRFANFASAGAAWIVSEENWLKDKLSFLSFVKFSANIGTSGSDGVGPYQYQPNWAVAGSSPYQTFPGYTPKNPQNPVFAWASNRKFNEQIDLGFFKDRLLVNFAMYQNNSKNQLVGYLQPIQTGFPNITANAPYTVNNSGWELSIASTNVNSKDFRWTTNINMSHNSNKLAKFDDIASSAYANFYIVGKPVNILQLMPFEGVNSQTGFFEFRKADGTITSFPSNSSGFNNVGGDRTVLLDLNPTLQGGIGNTFSYKNLSLHLFFQGSIQKGNNYLYNIYASGVTFLPGRPLVNMPAAILGKQWQKPGDEATLQRFVSGFNGSDGYMAIGPASSFANSNGAYSDASYIRLKTASLSYILPQNWAKKVFLKNCSFYVNAQNLFTITGYELGDPETRSLFAIPPQKTVVLGINASL